MATVVDPHSIASGYTNLMIAKRGSYSWLDMSQKHFESVAVDHAIGQTFAEWQKSHLIRSLVGIEERWKHAVKVGTASQRQAIHNIDQLSEASVIESFRQVYLRQELSDVRASNRSADGKVQMAMMLSTTADEPDDEHAHLEGEVLPATQVIEATQRFGCQHSFKYI